MWSFLEKNGLLGQSVVEEVNIRDLSDKAVVNLAKFFTLDDALIIRLELVKSDVLPFP